MPVGILRVVAIALIIGSGAGYLGFARSPHVEAAEDQLVILRPLLLAGGIHLGLALLLLSFRPPREPESDDSPVETRGKTPVGAWLGAIAAIVLSVWLVLPATTFSLWGDEQWSWRESIGGRFVRDATAATVTEHQSRLVWEQIGWDQTIWRYLTTNHHFLYSILGRVSNGLWQRATGAAEYEFSEAALRSVSLVAGAIGLLLWAHLVAAYSIAAAVVGSLLLAIHPWFLQYLVEARGYPLLFALLPALLLALRSACRSGGRRAWAAVAVAQAATVYAWPGMVFALAGLQISVFAYLWFKGHRADRRGRSIWRWIVANAASVMIVFQLTAPSLPLVTEYLASEVPERTVGLQWITNELSWFALGCDSHDFAAYAQRNPLYHTAESMIQNSPVATFLAIALFGTALCWGAILWSTKTELGMPILAGLLASAAGIWVAAGISGTALYAWYFVYLLPLVVMVAAIGLSKMSERIAVAIGGGSGAKRNALQAVLIVAALAVLVNVYRHPIASMRDRSKDPRRESVALTRPPGIAIDDPAQLSIITAHCNQPALSYDPHGWPLLEAHAEPDEQPGLIQLMRLADTVGATLWVNVGGVDSLERLYPDVADQLAQEALFERVHVVHGLAPQFERHLYRYKGGMFDFLRGL